MYPVDRYWHTWIHWIHDKPVTTYPDDITPSSDLTCSPLAPQGALRSLWDHETRVVVDRDLSSLRSQWIDVTIPVLSTHPPFVMIGDIYWIQHNITVKHGVVLYLWFTVNQKWLSTLCHICSKTLWQVIKMSPFLNRELFYWFIVG